MQPTQIHLDKSVQWFCADKVACAAARNEARDLTYVTCRAWIEDDNVIEAKAVGEFLAQ
jgi:hypothetical protein